MIATPLTIGIAGSTDRTRQCAQTLAQDPRFAISWVLTPAPRPVGRQQRVDPNPLHQWALDAQLPVVTVTGKKIPSDMQAQLLEASQHQRPDLLLVVDFGFLVPEWLLAWPRVAPLNIHPSLLPRWRGSSPGQFVVLYGETESAVTLMVMSAGLDEGPIIHQWPLTATHQDTAVSYYQQAFAQIQPDLGTVIAEFAAGHRQAQPQPTASPTPIARRLSKTDAFVDWRLLQPLLSSAAAPVEIGQTSQLLQDVQATTGVGWPVVLARACRAFQPWPYLWTEIPTTKGVKRMQIRACQALETTTATQPALKLIQVQIEGQQTAAWNAVKNSLI
jgi:methionyl-tRNA formyltransferase